MKVTSIDRQTIRMINAEVDSALQAIGEKYGLSMKMGNSTFSHTNFTTKYTASVKDSSGVAVTPEAQDWDRFAHRHGITAKVGDTFTTPQGDTYTIMGWKHRSHKYPILASSRNGKVYKFTVRAVKYALEAVTA